MVHAFLPFREMEIWSPLSPEQVTARISGAVEPHPVLNWLASWIIERSGRPLAGRIRGGHFVLRRYELYGRSFSVVLRGRVEPLNGGSVLVGAVTPNLMTVAFLSALDLWACSLGIYFLWFGSSVALLFPAVIAFSHAVLTIAFLCECDETRAALANVVDSRRIVPGTSIYDSELDP